jgi:hypothetical protein
MVVERKVSDRNVVCLHSSGQPARHRFSVVAVAIIHIPVLLGVNIIRDDQVQIVLQILNILTRGQRVLES